MNAWFQAGVSNRNAPMSRWLQGARFVYDSTMSWKELPFSGSGAVIPKLWLGKSLKNSPPSTLDPNLEYEPSRYACNLIGGAFDSAKNHKRQRRKRQSVTAKREKSQTPKFE